MKTEDLAILCYGLAGLAFLFGLYQHIARPILRRIITAIGGGVFIALIVVFTQRLRSIPNDRVLLTAIFCTAAVILYLLGLVRTASVEKPSPPSDTNPLHDRIAELEREKTALEKARQQNSDLYEKAKKENDTLQMVISGRIKELESYKWVHDIADNDKRNLSKYVYIIFSKVKYEGLDEIEPQIEIFFNIINASVYNIIIGKDIQDGAVYFNGLELNPKQAKLDGSLHSISRDDRGEIRVLIIKQWVSPELAKRIKNPQPNDKLSFNRLWLNVRAANNSEIEPQRLSLPSEIPVEIQTDLKPEIEGLNNQVAALESARKEDAKRINDEVNNNANTYKYLETVKSDLRAVTTERDSLKYQLEELNRWKVTFEVSKQSQVHYTDIEAVSYFRANLLIQFENKSGQDLTMYMVDVSLYEQTAYGEEKKVDFHVCHLNIERHPAMSKVDFSRGLKLIAGELSDWYWFQFAMQFLFTEELSADCFLRVTMSAMNQDPLTRDYSIDDWEAAQHSNSDISERHQDPSQNGGSIPNS